jgi:predicted DNA-binding transcriptional regulator YafY
MRRADRLFQIVQHLRGRRLATAAALAGSLGISKRTLYRDIRDLSLSGVPIRGEAGVGYSLAKTFDLPPIMFNFDEVEALVAGVRAIESWGGPELAVAARSALAKVTQALPPARRSQVDASPLFSPGFHVAPATYAFIDPIRMAILERRKLDIAYLTGGERESRRVVRPLGLYFWGSCWTLAAWCEVRTGFRTFRLDRIRQLEVLMIEYSIEAGTTLEDFVIEARKSRREQE